MKLKEPDMKQFEEEMKVFEEKMKVFEKEMEVYQKKLEASTEYYINGEKVTKEEVDKMQPNEIKSVNVRKNSTPNRIEIKKKGTKKIQNRVKLLKSLQSFWRCLQLLFKK